MNKMRVMVMWSGGVESTSLLKHLLEETDLEIVAHHIKTHNPEGRLQHELAAIKKLTPILQSIRPFEYTESEVSVCDGNGITFDYALHYTIAAASLKHHRCEKLLRAGCIEDEWLHMILPDGTPHLRFFGPNVGDLHRHRAQILTHTLRSGQTPEQVAPWLEFYTHSKGYHIQQLGELFQHTWSCRRPVDDAPCGTCHSCKEVEAGLQGTSANPEVATLIADGTIK